MSNSGQHVKAVYTIVPNISLVHHNCDRAIIYQFPLAPVTQTVQAIMWLVESHDMSKFLSQTAPVTKMPRHRDFLPHVFILVTFPQGVQEEIISEAKCSI